MTFADCSKMDRSAPELLSLCTTVPPAPAADRAGVHLDPGQPAAPVPADHVHRAAQQPRASSSRSRPSRRSRWTYARRCSTTRGGRSPGPGRSSPTRRPTTSTCSGTTSLPISRGHPVPGYPSSRRRVLRAGGNPLTPVVNPFAGAIRVYQRYIWLPGTVYGLILLAGLAAMAWRWRRGGRAGTRCCRGRARVALIVVPAATARVRLPLRDDGGAVRLPGALATRVRTREPRRRTASGRHAGRPRVPLHRVNGRRQRIGRCGRRGEPPAPRPGRRPWRRHGRCRPRRA